MTLWNVVTAAVFTLRAQGTLSLSLNFLSLLRNSRTYFFQDLDLVKTQKIIRCETITRGA
jgi:hypothetical protein